MNFTEHTPETLPSTRQGSERKDLRTKRINVNKSGIIFLSKGLADLLELEEGDRLSFPQQKDDKGQETDQFYVTNNGKKGEGFAVRKSSSTKTFCFSSAALGRKIGEAFYGEGFRENFKILVAGEPTVDKSKGKPRAFYGLLKLPNV